ncbi:MAG: hypothetical protein ACI4V1_02880 [Eubacteriales bacterium]
MSLIFALLLLFQMVSCSSGSTEQENTGAASPLTASDSQPNEETETGTETEKPYLDNLPEDLNFGEQDFTVLVRDERVADMFVEELTGEAVSDAIAERTIKLEERLGIKFQVRNLPSDSGQWKTAISGSVQAADGAYDVVFPDYWWGIELGGYYQNLMELPYLDFSQPYWCAGWNENNEFYGKLYTAVGDFSLDLILNTEAIFFNQRLIDQLQLESPYDLVKENRWTSDKLIEMSESALLDLDGDGTYNPSKDQFGLMYNLHGGRGYLYAYGMRLANKTEDGGWALDYYNDQFVKIYETVYKMTNETPSVHYATSVDVNARFASGNLLFLTGGLASARLTELREMEDDFGIVPYPKLDETQNNYISFNFGTSYAAVLKSAGAPEMSAAVLEALCAENHKSVVPVLYEDALKEKYSRDSTTAEMLDILQSTTYFDFVFVNDAALGALCNYYYDSIVSKSQDVSSLYTRRAKVSEKQMEKLLESYQDD